MHVNLVIPMAGYGESFSYAGYKEYKPFIKINGKCMIDWVVNNFPRTITKYLIVNKDIITKEQINHLNSLKNTCVIKIKGHKLGPGYSIFKAIHELPLNESFFISYCDIYWTWNYHDVDNLLDKYDGVIFIRNQFHPHLIENNKSAFCLINKNNPFFLEKIKEKGSFTNDWIKEPLSIGLFYIKSGYDLYYALNSVIKKKHLINNEYYPSIIFNELVDVDKKIFLSEVDFFIHWGLPGQMEDFIHWSAVLKNNGFSNYNNKNNMRNICCMAGNGIRMKSLTNIPKALLKINNMPMFEYVLKTFHCNNNILLITNNIEKQLLQKQSMEYEKINVGKQTISQIDTLLKSLKYILKCKNFFITSCDAFGHFNQKKLVSVINKDDPDVIVFAFKPSLTQSKLVKAHTYITIDKDIVKEVNIKHRKYKNDKGLAGFFWFKSGKIFKYLYDFNINNKEMHIDHFIKYLVEIRKKVISFPLDQYIHLGTVEEYLEYKFWAKYSYIFNYKLNLYNKKSDIYSTSN